MSSKQFYHDIDLVKVGQLVDARFKNVDNTTEAALATDLGTGNVGLVIYNTEMSAMKIWNGTAFQSVSADVTGDIVFRGVINPTNADTAAVDPVQGNQYVVDTEGTLSKTDVTFSPSAVVEVGDIVLFTSATEATVLQRNIVDATTSQKGQVELATLAETNAGTDTTRAVTPASLADVLSDISTNAANIATNTSDIATNTSDIATNTSDIATNASNIATNTSAIATNTSDIATNTSDIAANTSDIATNTSDIATNTSDIATNAANIATNTSDIATNTSAIATNTSAIATNTSDIATNAANIATNTSDIATNASNIATNTSDIATNASNIASNTSDIATNTSDISDNATAISNAQAEIDKIETAMGAVVDANGDYVAHTTSNYINANTNVTADLLDLDAQVKANADNIATNTSDIATNTSDIATNTSNIATNTSDIATNTSDIATLQSRDNVLAYSNNSVNVSANTPLTINHQLGLTDKDFFTIRVCDSSGSSVSVDVDSVDTNNITITSLVSLTALKVFILGI